MMLNLQIKRTGEQLGQPAPGKRDVNAIGSDFHAAEQGHKHRFDWLRCVGSEVFREPTAAFDKLAAS